MKPKIETIVCPIFNPDDVLGFEYACSLSEAYSARLLVISVANDHHRTRYSPGTPDYEIRTTKSVAAFESSPRGTYAEFFELRGESTTGIRDFAIENDADILVIANDQAIPEQSILSGKARALVESAPCTVLIAKKLDDTTEVAANLERSPELATSNVDR